MSHVIWLVQFSFLSVFLLGASVAFSLTPEEVLKLKAAGVSEKTIQLMLEKEQEGGIPRGMVEQGYATDHMGTWKLPDGRTITSTGKRQLPLHYSTEYPPPSPYDPTLSPYIAIPPAQDQSTFPSSTSPSSFQQSPTSASPFSRGASPRSSSTHSPRPLD